MNKHKDNVHIHFKAGQKLRQKQVPMKQYKRNEIESWDSIWQLAQAPTFDCVCVCASFVIMFFSIFFSFPFFQQNLFALCVYIKRSKTVFALPFVLISDLLHSHKNRLYFIPTNQLSYCFGVAKLMVSKP